MSSRQNMYFNQVEFGQRLQECRKLQKLTQEELAGLVGVEKQHISFHWHEMI